MTWLHMLFGLFYIPAIGQAKSAQQLISTVLPFHPYIFHALLLGSVPKKTLVRAQVGLDAVGLGGPRGGIPKAHESTRLVGFGSEQAYWILYSKLDYRISPLN